MQYTTKLGDTFDSIAFEYYNNERMAKTIMDANIRHIDKVIFSSSVVLTIPVVDTTPEANLPPWKR